MVEEERAGRTLAPIVNGNREVEEDDRPFSSLAVLIVLLLEEEVVEGSLTI